MLIAFSLFIAGVVFPPSIITFTQLPDGCPGIPGTPAASPAKSNEELAREAQLEARAAEIRTTFVRRYGTQEEIAAFEHPRKSNENSKRPKGLKPTDPEPTQIFDRVFHRVEYNKDYEGFTRVQAASIGTSGKNSAIGGITGPGGTSFNYTGGAGTFHSFYPEEFPATMLSGPGRWRISEPQRWELTARLQKRFMQDGHDAFSGTRTSLFLARLHEPPGSYHGKLVGFFGPAADKQYQLASEEEKRAMEKTALMMTVAATVILGTRVGM